MREAISYQAGQYNKISSIVDRFLFINGLHESWFQWALEVAMWQLRELNLDTTGQPKTELFQVSDRKTVILPSNCVDVMVVAMQVGQYFVTMGVNPKLTLTDRTTDSETVVGLLSQNLPNGLDFNSYGGFYLFNYNGATAYSFGGGFKTKGMYRIKDYGTCKEILMDYDYLPSHIYVEYLTDGIDLCKETILNSYYCDYCYKSIEAVWEEKKNPSRTEASIQRKQRDLSDAGRVVRARKNDLDPQTMLNIQRQETRFTPHI
jgi:hypothetical protein